MYFLLLVWFSIAFPETAYLFAIHSASLAHSFIQTCSQGRLASCYCSQTSADRVYYKQEQLFTEGYRCTEEYIQFGIHASRNLLTNNKENDVRWLIDNHNKEAGRQVRLY